MAQKKQRSTAGASHRKDLIDELFNASIETDPSLQLESEPSNADQEPTAPLRTHQQKTEILSVPIPTPTLQPIETGKTQGPFDPELERLLKTEIAVIRPTGAHPHSAASTQSPHGPTSKTVQKTPSKSAQSNALELLQQTGGMKAAQEKITTLEAELEKVRSEAETMRVAAMAFEKRLDEMTERYHRLKSDWDSVQALHQEEKNVLKELSQSRESEIVQLKLRLEQTEEKIRGGLGKVRSRERELEHRIEMMKTESLLLAAAKDKAILELKRQVDGSAHEISKARQHAQDLAQQLRDKQDVIVRAVRALRLASTVLETADEQEQSKKTGS